MLLGGRGEFANIGIYDVTDPVHPRLLCRIQGTSAHLTSGLGFQYLDPRSANETDIVASTLAGARVALAGQLSAWSTSAVWLPGGAVGAFTMQVGVSDQYPVGGTQVWTFKQGTSQLLFTYSNGFGDCICRFGLPGPVLAISPDGQYLVAGRLAGKGSEAFAVYRLADRVRVATLLDNVSTAFWDRSTDRLFEVYYDQVQVWTPQGSTYALAGVTGWNYDPNVSPDGAYVVYTAFADAVQGTQPRVYLYTPDLSKTQMLIDQPRSQVVFVKDGWVWYLEEAACSDCPNGTQPTGKVFAMNLATRVEQQVTFAPGEGLIYSTDLLPGEFWPNS